jgi:hypothetical protein
MKVLQVLFNPSELQEIICPTWSYLANQVRKDIQDIAGNTVDIVNTIETDNFMLFSKEDGYVYTLEEYQDVIARRKEPHKPDIINYNILLDELNAVTNVKNRVYDEIWIWGIPWLGLYESRMIGNKTHWLNSEGLKKDCRNFVVMGLNYERDTACALEAFAHRVEAVFFTNHKILWHIFKSQVGTVHIPPNGIKDYDFDNTDYALSHCDLWVNNNYSCFDMFRPSKKRYINKEEWASSEGYHYGYMKWWMNHVPRSIIAETFKVDNE